MERLRVGFAVDEHEIGFDVAVSEVFPLSDQSVVAVVRLERLVFHEEHEDREKIAVECRLVAALEFTLVVPLELAGTLNRPHEDRP